MQIRLFPSDSVKILLNTSSYHSSATSVKIVKMYTMSNRDYLFASRNGGTPVSLLQKRLVKES
jgi:hypothetical protein